MANTSEKAWHHLTKEEIFQTLESDGQAGLSDEQAQKRLETYGENVIQEKEEKSALVRFILQFHQPLIYILLGATAFTIVLEEYVDAAVIFGVVLVNAIIGFVQENKAVKAIGALSQSMTTGASVLRNGEKKRMEAKMLVPGDIVLIEAGDRIPADLRLIKDRDLQADESALTGESVPAAKQAEDTLEEDTILAERTNMVYASTVATGGQGRGIVIATGDNTEVGKISGFVSSAPDLATPLTKKINEFSRILLYVILALAAATMVIGLIRGQAIEEIFLSAVALAVGAIPEGLPAAVTIMLAIGVSKMAKKQAIIRKLVAVETLGSTTIICSDKTGTLTKNQMTVRKIYAGDAYYVVEGAGYEPEGKIKKEEQEIDTKEELSLQECLRCGILCNESNLYKKEEQWTIEGDPTDGAVLVSARKVGLNENQLSDQFPRADIIPFDSEYQYMATLHTGESTRAYIKGSMEAILQRCSNHLNNQGETNSIDKNEMERVAEELSAEGLRVIAMAKKEMSDGKKEISHEDLEEDLTFLGLQGIIDPPREETKMAVEMCQRAGIHVKMITGDHALTASTIAGMIGLKGRKQEDRLEALTGKAMSKFSDEDYENVVEDIAVFARVNPEQKLKLVKAMQAKNNIVAMTGDGVNDAPALKQANIGIAMGITGTDVAKDASDMVLTNDNFASIEEAVEEGRGVFDNLTKFITWTLPTNLGEGLVILAAIILGTSLPILPLHILWINMTTAVLLGLTLAFEPKEGDIMERPPRDPDQPILTFPLVMRTLFVGLLLLVSAFGLFQYELSLGTSEIKAQTVAATVFVVVEGFYLFNCRSLIKPAHQIGYFSNPWVYYGAATMLVLQLLFIYLPIMNSLFNTAPIGLASWIRVAGAGLIVHLIIATEKWIRRVKGSSSI